MITDKQVEVMKHCVSDHNRNWFGTSNGTEDCILFDELVKKGLATKHDAPSYWGDDFVFRLTDAGIKHLKERKDHE